MDGLNSFSLLLVLNSLLIIGLVLTQNDNTKDSANQNNSRTSPLEIIIFLNIIFQLILLLISSKITDF
jgi:hypothetical protein